MHILKSIYHFLLPDHIRGGIRLTIFKYLRKTGVQPWLNKLGILIGNSYQQVNHSNAKEILKSTKFYLITEKHITKPAYHIEEEQLDEMEPLVIVTENVILDLKDSSFYCTNNFLVDQELNIIGGYRTNFENLSIYQHILPKPTKLKGTLAYLSESDPQNYYHWMCGTLPLIRFYQNLVNWTDIDYFYIGKFPLSSFHNETLAKVGICQNKVVQEACGADRILAAISSRFINFNDPISKEAYTFTRSLFTDVSYICKDNDKLRIYVMRGNVTRRKVINETEVIDLLNKYEFKVVTMDNKTVQEQAEIFSKAEAIVAPHGAALTNLLFAQPNTTVIEILPDGYINNCFYVLANYGNLKYFYMKGEKKYGKNNAHHIDIYVNLEKLKKICNLALDR